MTPPIIEQTQDSGLAGGERVLIADVQLTNAQLLAIRATPINLVAAPGAGWAIVVDALFMYFDSAGAYTVGTNDLTLEYGSGADIVGTIETVGFMDQATDQARHVAPAAGSLLTPIVNSAVRLFNSGAGEFTGGNAANTLSCRVHYHLVQMAAFN